MSEINIDLLRKDECQPLTNEQMTEIKSQFHPSNTANVNIVPYEIYDEDGAEIVVGEVRKTIDGVKKKKPVYKKVIVSGSITAKSGTIANISSLNCEKFYKFETVWESSGNAANTTVFGDNTYQEVTDKLRVYLTKNDNNIQYGLGSSYPITPGVFTVTFIYTKTTDEWQPV